MEGCSKINFAYVASCVKIACEVGIKSVAKALKIASRSIEKTTSKAEAEREAASCDFGWLLASILAPVLKPKAMKTASQKAKAKAAREKFEASGLEAVWSEEGRAGTPVGAGVGGGGGVWLSWIQQLYSVI